MARQAYSTVARQGAARQGHGKVERGHRWGSADGGRRKLNKVTDGATGKRSEGHTFTYTERASVAIFTLSDRIN